MLICHIGSKFRGFRLVRPKGDKCSFHEGKVYKERTMRLSTEHICLAMTFCLSDNNSVISENLMRHQLAICLNDLLAIKI
jgi:hypothetical protein